MIIREIKDNTEEELKNFDWFNDYKDTRNWASHICPEVVPKLDEGYKQWLQSKKKKNETIQSNQSTQRI